MSQKIFAGIRIRSRVFMNNPSWPRSPLVEQNRGMIIFIAWLTSDV